MRRLTVVADPGERRLVSVFDAIEKERVKREYLHHYNLLTNGTVVLIYQLHGDLDYARAVFDASLDVIHYDIPKQDDGLVYLHCEMNESLTALLSVLQESEVIMAMPVEFLSDDRLRLTFIGEHEPLNGFSIGYRSSLKSKSSRSENTVPKVVSARCLLTDSAKS